MDKLSNWILSVLGCCSADMQLISEFYDDLGCDFLDDEEDMIDEIRLAVGNYGYQLAQNTYCRLSNLIAEHIFKDTIDRAVDQLSADKDKFEYWVNGSDTWIKYNGEYFSSWQDLEDLINEDKEIDNG